MNTPRRLRDINPGSGRFYLSNLTAVGSSLYFSATDGSNGAESWAWKGSDLLPAISCR